MLIANKPPAVSADTHDHGGLDRRTSDASLVHTPIASSASPTSDRPAGGSSDTSSCATVPGGHSVLWDALEPTARTVAAFLDST